MFNNLINAHDFVVLYEKLRGNGPGKTATKFIKSGKERVKLSWAHTSGGTSNWWDIPEVNRRWNLMITGSPDIDHYRYVSAKYLNVNHPLNGISLGCGTGNREVRWVSACETLRLSCYDISKERIRQAGANAKAASVDSRLTFAVGDVHTLDLGLKMHDIAIVEGALHHFHPMISALEKIGRSLKDDAIFVVNEYVGPSRFQWTERQLESVNQVLQLIPGEFRKNYSNGRVKEKVYRPGRLSMFLNDPSEAAESDLIETAIADRFRILERKEYGGTLLQLLFKDIAHNFVNENKETKELLERIFSIEDGMLKSGELKSDFVFFICTNRKESSS